MSKSSYAHPDRKTPAFRPFKAMHHMNKLLADGEDTEQVFQIIEALNGNSFLRNLERFAATPKGAARLEARGYLPPMLDDHAPLRDLPDGSVGRAYIAFMKREGLSAQGLVDESEKFYGDRPRYDDAIDWYGNWMRDTHDLFHVLTGYGRDGLGETALLGFSHSQTPGRGVIFIAYMGARQLRKYLPKDARIMDVLKEGRRHGTMAKRIAAEDIQAMLKEPLEDVRKRLNIQPPVLYQQTMVKYGADLAAAKEEQMMAVAA